MMNPKVNLRKGCDHNYNGLSAPGYLIILLQLNQILLAQQGALQLLHDADITSPSQAQGPWPSLCGGRGQRPMPLSGIWP